MKFGVLADAFAALEKTTKRLEMRDILVDLIQKTPCDVIDKVMYLAVGKLYPPFMGIELGVAEKLAIRAIAKASGLEDKEILEDFKSTGDLGVTAEKFLKKKAQVALTREPLTVARVYDTFEKIAHATGAGSQEFKIDSLARLLTNADPREARYIVRMVTGKLRLGVADMTILDALAMAYGGGIEARDAIERAYNLSSDLGYVAKTLAEKGMNAIHKFKVTVGRPIRPQLAERMASLKEILEKLGGQGFAEYKYDGIRIQGHVSPDKVQLFSRRLENITSQFPDICEELRRAVKAKEAIVDGECVPVDPDTGDLLPFQVVAQRRGRKYEIEEMMKEVPVILFLFDALYIDGEDLTLVPYPERRKRLESIIKETDKLKIAKAIATRDHEEISRFFDEAVQAGCEGLLLKSIMPDSFYEAGKRGFQWIKWKRSYRSEMQDTVDLVVVGAFAGRGRRAGSYGALLMAAYDPKEERFKTICKLGSGFTDEDLVRLPGMFKPLIIDHKHPRVDSIMEADYWFVPEKVLEVIGDELTLSDAHTCAYGQVKEGRGLAIRFPRLVRFREDRAPEDATTIEEIVSMYQSQLKRIAEKA